MDRVTLDLITQKKLRKMTQDEKIAFLLEEVKQGKILILERGLDPLEETKLIETTMSKIDHETFIGIELESYEAEASADEKLWHKLLRKEAIKPRITVIGPAEMMKTIYKDGSMLQAMIYKKGTPIQMLQQEKVNPPMEEIIEEEKEMHLLEDERSLDEKIEIQQMEIIKEEKIESEMPIIEEMKEENKELPIMEEIKQENTEMLVLEEIKQENTEMLVMEEIKNFAGTEELQQTNENTEQPLMEVNSIPPLTIPQQEIAPPKKEKIFNFLKRNKK